MRTTVVVIGGGQAGLAMSWWLTRAGIDHVVLERGVVAQSWRTRRWHSLRLLTPNWMTRLPGHSYDGDDPDGYQRADEVVALLDAYARAFDAPVRPHTTVVGVAPDASGFQVDTDDGSWRCRAVVVATGTEGEAKVPALARDLPDHLQQITALGYREPGQVAPGEVLVVGASASGVQIADELQRAGRRVTVAVGDHVRVPRTYRGRDIYRWMHELGILDERYDEVPDLVRARRLPSLQLAGTPQRRTLDLAALSAAGVELTGRFVGVARGRAQFSGSLPNLIKAADLKQGRPAGPHRRPRRRARPAGPGRAARPASGHTDARGGDRAGPGPVLRRGLGHRTPTPLPLARPGLARPPRRHPPRRRAARGAGHVRARAALHPPTRVKPARRCRARRPAAERPPRGASPPDDGGPLARGPHPTRRSA